LDRQRQLLPIISLKEHPLANLVPDMRPDEWREFYQDIAMRGIRQDIEVLADGTILDGRHRFRAAKALGLKEVWTISAPLNGDSPEDYMLKAAVLRRHLTDDQRKMIAAIWKDENRERPGPKIEIIIPPPSGKTPDTHRGKTATQASEIFKISRRGLDKATYVHRHNPELAEKVHQGDIALNNAYRQVKGIEERVKIASTVPPTGTYQVIIIDPPWPFTSRQNDPSHEISSPYETMSIEDIKSRITIPATDDSILWLWVPNAFLHEAFHVLEAWGFRYRTTLTWAKNFVGLGDWLGGQTEHCLMATKGNYKVFRNNESTLLQAPRGAHSEKPDSFYELITKLCPGNKLDMFNRRPHDGFKSWGAEAGNG
jgi:N6-adenosine-specific RNA methylase IME4